MPQWNCGCRVCRLAWSGDHTRSLADPVEFGCLRRRRALAAAQCLDRFAPARFSRRRRCGREGEGRHSPIAAVLLTGTDVDIAGGLLTLRERQPLTIWGTRQDAG